MMQPIRIKDLFYPYYYYAEKHLTFRTQDKRKNKLNSEINLSYSEVCLATFPIAVSTFNMVVRKIPRECQRTS